MTLLIVDDEARIRDLIRKYAAFEGYNVEEASNGMEAIEKCRQKNVRPHHHGCDDARTRRLLRLPRNPPQIPSSRDYAFRRAARSMTASTASSWALMIMSSSPFRRVN